MTPVALFAYFRAAHLKRTLGGLKQNRVERIYAFCDAAKSPELAAQVDEVRKLVRAIDWCEVTIVERGENLGLGRSVRAGVTQVLREHPTVVVVEDDIVFRPGAMAYVEAAMEHYFPNPKVMTISMWSHPALVPAGATAGFFSRRFICWGWATTREAWASYQESPWELCERVRQAGGRPEEWGNDLLRMARDADRLNLWYVGYVFCHLLNQGLSFVPAESLTVNIGVDGSGENSQPGSVQNEALLGLPAKLPKRWPEITLEARSGPAFVRYFGDPVPNLAQRARIVLGRWRQRVTKHP